MPVTWWNSTISAILRTPSWKRWMCSRWWRTRRTATNAVSPRPSAVRVDDRPVAADHPLVLEAPEPSRAGRRRQARRACHLGDGGSAIAPQEVEDHAIRSIEHCHRRRIIAQSRPYAQISCSYSHRSPQIRIDPWTQHADSMHVSSSSLADHGGHSHPPSGVARPPGLLSDLPDDDVRAPVGRRPLPRGDRGRGARLLHAPRESEPRRTGRRGGDARGRRARPRLRLGHGRAHHGGAGAGARGRPRRRAAEHVRRLAEPGAGAAATPRRRLHAGRPDRRQRLGRTPSRRPRGCS